jgi:hypothetical protein
MGAAEVAGEATRVRRHRGRSASPPIEATARAKPIGGIRLALAAFWASIRGFFRRLFGKREA